MLLLALLLALPMAGAATSYVPTSMRVALVSEPVAELYPLLVIDRDIVAMLDLVYESLIVLDDTRQPAPGLATSWTTSSDGKTWTFQLREGVQFHDGKELYASDVVATLDQIKAHAGDLEKAPTAANGLYANTARVCKSWKASEENRYELTIQTDRPASLLYALTFPVLQAQSAMQPNPPGTGPYRIAYYNPGEELWLVGNQNWYGPSPYVSELVGVWYPSVDAAMTAYEAENVDILMTRSTSVVRYRGTGSTRANAYDYSTRQLEVLLMNGSSRGLNNQLVRQAVAHAINKQILSTNVYQNMVTTTNTIQSPASWLYNTDVSWYRYDKGEAARLLDEAGWNSFNENGYRIRVTESGETQVLDLRLNYYDEAGSALRKQAASEIAEMLREVGFRVRVSGMSFENATAKLSTNVSDYDLFLCAYNFDVVPDPSFMLISNGYGNYARYRSDDVTKWAQTIRKTADMIEFEGLWHQIQAQVAEDVPFIPLYWRNGVIITRYPYSSVRDIREYEQLRSINEYR